jgi:hypothetical protein
MFVHPQPLSLDFRPASSGFRWPDCARKYHFTRPALGRIQSELMDRFQ